MKQIDIIVVFKPAMTMLGTEYHHGSIAIWSFDGQAVSMTQDGMAMPINWPDESTRDEVVNRLIQDASLVFVAEFNERGTVARELPIHTAGHH